MWGYGQDRDISGQGQVAGCCDCGNGLSDSIHCGEFLDNRNPVIFSRRTVLHGVSFRANYIRHYADFRKAWSMFVIAVRSSVHTHRITWPVLDAFEKNKLIIWAFERLQRNVMFCKILTWKMCIFIQLNVYVIQLCDEFFLEKKFVEQIKRVNLCLKISVLKFGPFMK